tara:strand:- start:326 stop:742 length:417 start_codon:yes stop_codon:yes gene_type:complete
MQKTKEKNYALQNAIGHIKSIVEDYENFNYIDSLNVTCDEDYEKQEEIKENILNSALSVEFRSGWTSNPNELEIEEFKILLTWGGPALRVIGELNQYKEPENIKMQYQDWGTFWTDFEITEEQQKALNWFCSCFYFGE